MLLVDALAGETRARYTPIYGLQPLVHLSFAIARRGKWRELLATVVDNRREHLFISRRNDMLKSTELGGTNSNHQFLYFIS